MRNFKFRIFILWLLAITTPADNNPDYLKRVSLFCTDK